MRRCILIRVAWTLRNIGGNRAAGRTTGASARGGTGADGTEVLGEGLRGEDIPEGNGSLAGAEAGLGAAFPTGITGIVRSLDVEAG